MKSKGWILVAVVALSGAVWFLVSNRQRPEPIAEVRGKITFVDVSARTGSLEYPDPDSGEAVEVSARVADDAVITLNGLPAQLDDLRPGHDVLVRAKITRRRTEAGKTREINAFEVHATTTTSTPNQTGGAGSGE